MSIRALLSDLRFLLEGVDMRSPTAEEIAELKKFARSVYKGISVKQHKTAKGVTMEVRGPYKDEKFTTAGAACARICQWLIDNNWVQWPSGSADDLQTKKKNAEEYDAFYDIGLLMKVA